MRRRRRATAMPPSSAAPRSSAHVAVLPALQGRELRGLGAELVAGAAADVAVLGDELGEQAVDPFPGSIP